MGQLKQRPLGCHCHDHYSKIEPPLPRQVNANPGHGMPSRGPETIIPIALFIQPTCKVTWPARETLRRPVSRICHWLEQTTRAWSANHSTVFGRHCSQITSCKILPIGRASTRGSVRKHEGSLVLQPCCKGGWTANDIHKAYLVTCRRSDNRARYQ